MLVVNKYKDVLTEHYYLYEDGVTIRYLKLMVILHDTSSKVQRLSLMGVHSSEWKCLTQLLN